MSNSAGTTADLQARLQADQEWRAINTQLEAARAELSRIETQLVADRELARQPAPPQTIARPGSRGFPWDQIPNPAYDAWKKARANVTRYDDPLLGDDTALKALEALRKRVADLELDLGAKASDIQTARTPAEAAPPVREINGVLQERNPRTGEWEPARVAGAGTIAAGPGVDARLVGKPTGTTIRRDIEAGPGGARYYVEYFYGPGGQKEGVASDEQNRPQLVEGGLGTDPNAAVTLQTAQTNLAIAQQRLAEATSPEAREEARLKVEQARLALQTAQTDLERDRERAPIDLATAQTNLALAQQRLAEATSPEAQEQRRVELERARFDLEQARATGPLELQTAQARLEQAQRLQDPVAEYQRQVQLQQQSATTYRDQLNDKVLRGELTVEDASSQFDRWWDTNVEARLTPYRTMAEGAYRKEQNEYQQRVAAEQARVDAINRQREQTAYAAGEKARQDLMTLAPQGRSPEFLNQLAENVSRIGQPLPGGPSQHGGGMRFSPESLSLDAVKRSQPSITGVGQAAVARALAQISPAAAQSVGAPPPQVPSLPQFADFMGRAPFSIPNPALPVPGREALDLGNPANAGLLGLPVQPGFAGTQYQGGRVEPWLIPQG